MAREIPEFMDRVVRKPLGYTRDSQLLFKSAVVSAAPATIYSESVRTLFNPFLLYLYIKSTGTGVQYVTLTWQYFDERSLRWYDLNQGFWSTLTFEDLDTASGLARCYHGDVSGKTMRLKAVCTSGSSSLYFTIDAYLDVYAAEVEP